VSRISELQPLRIIQLTDLHLFKKSTDSVGWCAACVDFSTDESQLAVLDEIQLSEPHFESFVVTGDIAQEPSLQTYQRFAKLVSQEAVPVYCLPGNHDEAELLQQALMDGPVSAPGFVVKGGWLLVFLDTSVVNEPAGYLSAAELQRLSHLLAEYPSHHTALFLHHPPHDVGSAWLDRIGLTNRQQLFDILDQASQVRAVVGGHIHQELDVQRGHYRILGTPSTCIQFLPKQKDFRLDSKPPGYRWLEMHANGNLDTAIRYLPLVMEKTA